MICVPIVGPGMEQALEDLHDAERYGDLIEFRLDLIEQPDLKRLIGESRKPVIVTNRTKREGGRYKGSEEARIQSLRQAIEWGANYIDIEASTPRQLLQPILEIVCQTKKILSYHHFSLTPDNLEEFFAIMSDTPADIIKIVTYAKNITDNIIIFNLLRRAKKEGKPLIAFCMGDLGEISRILSLMMGGYLTFGALDFGKESAPGQITAATLRSVYRAHKTGGDSKIYGVIGDPVDKSMGYLIHNRAFSETGLPHIYVPFLVSDVPQFFSAFEPFFDGLSVTMPHKEKIIGSLSNIGETAKKIGAVNTVVREAEDWVGYNTDCIGALKALEAYVDLNGKDVLIIGSGGTAKAIGHGVAGRGAKVTVTYNTNRKRGEALAKELQCDLAGMNELENIKVDVLINCSPVGMVPNIDKTPYLAKWLKSGMIVFDSVYNPLETRLIREAHDAGCTTISGVEFFVNQAVEQFELWTGKQAPVTAMRNVIIEKLKEQQA